MGARSTARRAGSRLLPETHLHTPSEAFSKTNSAKPSDGIELFSHPHQDCDPRYNTPRPSGPVELDRIANAQVLTPSHNAAHGRRWKV
jgi:hypothetical protein